MKSIETTKVLLDEIRNGRWQLGQRLPPERQITKELSVSRVTVRAALARLEEHGIITQRQGSGTYLVREPDRFGDREILLGFRADTPGVKERALRGKRIVTQRLLRFAFLHDLADNDPIGLATLGGIMAFSRRRGHEIIIGPSRSDNSPDFAPQVYQPDAQGVILVATLRPQDVPLLKKIPVPTVMLSTGDASAALPNAVSLDTVAGCQQAVRELAAKGHRRIAVLEKSFGAVHSRFAHECDYLRKDLGLPGITCCFGDDPLLRMPAGDEAPTALYVTDDVYCATLCRRLADRGVGIGRDIFIISQANRGIEKGLPPAVGRMEFDTAEWGRTAAHTLEYMLDEGIDEVPPIRLGARYLPGKTN